MPKLFFGIALPEPVRADIQHFFSPVLQEHGKGLRLSRPENWHITVHFIGHTTPRAAEKIIEQFNAVDFSVRFPAEIQLGGEHPIQAFGKNTIYLRVHDSNGRLHELNTWARAFVPVWQTHGAYRPHLTLARNPRDIPIGSLLEQLQAIPFTSTFRAGELILFDSQRVEERTFYPILARQRFSYPENPSFESGY